MSVEYLHQAFPTKNSEIGRKFQMKWRTGHEGPEGEQRCSSTFCLTSALDGMDGQLHALIALAPGKRPGNDYIGGWVGPRAGVNVRRKSRPTAIEFPDRLNCSQSLYRLRYLGPRLCWYKQKVTQSHYRPEVPRGFQEVKVLRLRDNGSGWW